MPADVLQAAGRRADSPTTERTWPRKRNLKFGTGRHNMINRKSLIGLAAITAGLFISAGVIGEDNDVLWIIDDIVFFGFIGCALALIVLSVGVLVRWATRSANVGSRGV
jgi:hypothetical protein